MRRAVLAVPLATLLVAGGCKEAPASSAPTPAIAGCAGVPDIALQGRVTDAAGILPAAEEARLSDRLARYEQRTTHQMVIATAPTLNNLDVATVGDCLGNRWGIGDKDRNDGILILVAPNERRARISTGSGLESMLTDEEAKAAIDQMTSHFRSNDFAGGLSAAVEAIAAQTGDTQ